MKVCPYCRRPVLDNALRCSYPDCGRDLSNVSVSPFSAPLPPSGVGTVPPPTAPAGYPGAFAPAVSDPSRPVAPATSSSGTSFYSGSAFNSVINSGVNSGQSAGAGSPLSPPPGFAPSSGFNVQPGSAFSPSTPGSGSSFASGTAPSFRPAAPQPAVQPFGQPPQPGFDSSSHPGSRFSPSTPSSGSSFTPGAAPSFRPAAPSAGSPNPGRGEQRSVAPPPPSSSSSSHPSSGSGFSSSTPSSGSSYTSGVAPSFRPAAPSAGSPNPSRGEQRSVAPPPPGSGPGSQNNQLGNRSVNPISGSTLASGSSAFGTNLPPSRSGFGHRGEQRSAAPPLPGQTAGSAHGQASNLAGERVSAPPPAPGVSPLAAGRATEMPSAPPPAPGVNPLAAGRATEMPSAPPPAPGMGPAAYGPGERTSVAPSISRMQSILQMGLPLSVPVRGIQSEAIPSSLLVIHDDDTPEQASLRESLRNLHKQVIGSRKNTKRLAAAVWIVFGCILISYFMYYSYTVGRYAQISEDDLSVQRDKRNPQELVISYKAASSGYIGFRRKFKDYSTEIFEKIDSANGLEKKFRWSGQFVPKEDPLLVSYRQGIHLERQPIPIPLLEASDLEAGLLASGGDSRSAQTGRGKLTGQILSALDNKPIPGATVRIVGSAAQTQTAEDGKFVLENIPEGNSKVEVSLSGYTTEMFNETVFAGNDKDIRVTMSPGLKEGQIRLVLTWNNSVQDLDAYLSGPKGNGENFRVSYSDKGNLQSNEFVSLDVDAQKGWGPETITILGVQPGEYEYQVHDYSNKDKPDSTALANAEAHVKLYYGGQTYNFIPEKDLVGGVWNVCKINVSDDRQVKVLRVNTIIREEESGQKFGLYAKRTMADRSTWIGKYGGSQESERAVTLGLDWLYRHQSDNGSWGKYCLKESGSAKNKCSDNTCTVCGGNFEMALTGLPVLTFQGGGHFYFNDNKYSENVKKALDWIVEHQAKNGVLISPSQKGKTYGESPYHQYFMYEHGIASFALVEACAVAKSMGEDPDPKYYNAAKKALRFTQSQQYPDGGWRYWTYDHLPNESVGDTSATGWQVLALKSGKEADIPIEPKVIERLKTFFTKRFMGDGQTGYEDKSNWTQATTGIGMLARQFLFNEPDAVEVKLGAEYLANWAPSNWTTPGNPNECDCYEWYHTMLAMYQAGGREWARFNPILRDFIIKQQKTEGCQAGSWDPLDNYAQQGGRIYTTSLSTLALEVYYRYAGAQERSGTSKVQTSSTEVVEVQAEEAQTEEQISVKEEQEKSDAKLKYAKEKKKDDAPEMDLGL